MPLAGWSTSFSVPVPERALTVTSKIVPLAAETPATVPAAVPVGTTAKAPVVTPFTVVLNVTRNTTLSSVFGITSCGGLYRTIVILGCPARLSVKIAEDALLTPPFDAVA